MHDPTEFSHDLRTPLATISGWIDIMEQSPDDAALIIESTARIRRAIKDQLRCIMKWTDEIRECERIERVVEEQEQTSNTLSEPS